MRRAITLRGVLRSAVLTAAMLQAVSAGAQQQATTSADSALAETLSAACRQDATAFPAFLTADNAAAFRALPEPQRTALMKRLVQLEDVGRPLLSTGANGHQVVRCATPGMSIEMRFGVVRLRENLAFVPMEIPLPGESPRSVTFGLVREGGSWKLLTVGLLLLDISSLAKQWELGELEVRENEAIASLRQLASALETYRRAYGKLPDSLATLGPAPPNGISPEAAGLVDVDLASGGKGGYAFRYTVVPAAGNLPEAEADKAAGFSLAATPSEYGKGGRRSFFLDSAGVLRGADKQGVVATSTDPKIGPS
jgi:type II secretory pathway pseudopilin PulG